ncbi:MAG: hypothetical protein F6K21_39640 [Symploca sp. SIO2D2]|nr:hypothetical protein [Symploca sp. SIO2D2]NER22855.1 hypothetical protein [Symploca sp. SIO1C2]
MNTRRQIQKRDPLRPNSLKTRKTSQAGYSLVQLIIVLFIVGILSSIAVVTGMGFVKDTTEKNILIKAEAYVTGWKINNGYYPNDMTSSESQSGQAPGELDNSASQPSAMWPKDIPADRILDYDHWPIVGSRCYVQVALRGKGRDPDYQDQMSREISKSGFKKIGRDIVRGIATCQCPCTKNIKKCRDQGKTWEC